MISSIVCNSNMNSIFYIAKNIINIIMIVAPILGMIVFSYLLVKMTISPDDKKVIKNLTNSLISIIIIFFIPMFITIVMYSLGESNDISRCYLNSKKIDSNSLYNKSLNGKSNKNYIWNPRDYERGTASFRLSYINARNIPSEVLSRGPNSNPSVVICDEDGKVLAAKDPKVLREGASTTKVFTGYAAVKLLDYNKDIIVGSDFVTNFVGVSNTNSVSPGQRLSVKQAATRAFPDSSNTAAEAIVVAIGKKYHNTASDADAHTLGVKEINSFLGKIGCEKTKLGNGSGLPFSPAGHMTFSSDGMATGEEGITANDLAGVTMIAMKDKLFLDSYASNSGTYAALATNRNNSGMFYIKSGTAVQCSGIWGFNKNGKRYYIALVGVNCNDDKYAIVDDIYNWAISSLV